MSFFKASTDKKDVKQSGSNHISKSGFFPITILAAFVSSSTNGSDSVDFYVEHAGQKQVLYGSLRITNNDGSNNAIGSKIFNQLLIISGLEEVHDPVEMELPIGKGGAMKNAAVLEDLEGIDVIVRVQMEYSIYKGNIQEKKVIKSFFRADDKATAEEIVNDDGEFGKGYEAEEKYADNVTYKDELTAEVVQKWIAGGRKKGSIPSGDGSSDSAPKKAPAFGKKRFGKSEGDDE